MSSINGDKSRYNRLRKQKLERRATRVAVKTARAEAKAAEPKS